MMLTLSFARVNIVLFWPPATKFPRGPFRRILAHRSTGVLVARMERSGMRGRRSRISLSLHPGYASLPPQPDHLAAVDHDCRPRHETAGVGGEQQQRAVEIALLAEKAGRDLPGDL